MQEPTASDRLPCWALSPASSAVSSRTPSSALVRSLRASSPMSLSLLRRLLHPYTFGTRTAQGPVQAFPHRRTPGFLRTGTQGPWSNARCAFAHHAAAKTHAFSPAGLHVTRRSRAQDFKKTGSTTAGEARDSGGEFMKNILCTNYYRTRISTTARQCLHCLRLQPFPRLPSLAQQSYPQERPPTS
ncbi:hypothetical protein BKA93DRAFT_560500 [Sparassis latifolia]